MTNSSKSKAEARGSSKGLAGLPMVLVLCLVGLGVAVELTRIHYFSHTDPDYHSICAVNEQVNCETVAQSRFSVFLDVPVSIWGFLGYGLMAALAGWGLWGRRLHPGWPWGALLIAVVLSFTASAVLAFISFTRIDSICIFCTVLYAINLLLLALVVSRLIKEKISPWGAVREDLKAAFSRPVLFSGLAGGVAGIAAALVFLFPPYWDHPGWADLPTLPVGTTKEGHHWIGAADPAVTVVEFSDYQCPHCRRAHKNARLLTAKYADSVRLVHRHLPLDSACNPTVTKRLHDRACEFSKAAECAAEQGGFWKMNDALFSIQDQLRADEVDIERIAVQLGLDRSSLMQCMKSNRALGPVRRDLDAARKRRIAGTPTFFIGAKPFQGNIPEKALKLAVKKTSASKQRHAQK